MFLKVLYKKEKKLHWNTSTPAAPFSLNKNFSFRPQACKLQLPLPHLLPVHLALGTYLLIVLRNFELQNGELQNGKKHIGEIQKVELPKVERAKEHKGKLQNSENYKNVKNYRMVKDKI